MNVKKIVLSAVCVTAVAMFTCGCEEESVELKPDMAVAETEEEQDRKPVVQATVEEETKGNIEKADSEEEEAVDETTEEAEEAMTDEGEEPEEVEVTIASKEETVETAEAPTEIVSPAPPAPPAPSVDVAAQKREEYMQRASDIDHYDDVYASQAYTQSEMNQHAENLYKKWDLLLNDVYKYLKATMSVERFKALEADEMKWIKEKEAAAKSAGAEFEGGTMQPLAEFSTQTEYTRTRCYYLIGLIG